MSRSYYPTDSIELNVSRGLVKGCDYVNLFGYNSSVGSADFVPLWENNTAYIFPVEALTMEAVSTSGSDTDVTLKIDGLNIDYNIISTTVDMDGANTVVIDTDFYRINSVVTISGNAQGTITISSGGATYAKIRAGEGSNQAAIYTVPAGYKFYLYRLDGFSATSNANKYILFRNYVRLSNGVELRVGETTFLNQFNISRVFPFVYSEKTDIQLQGKSSAQLNEMGIFAEGLLIKEGLE